MRKTITVIIMTIFCLMTICFNVGFKASAEADHRSEIITMDLDDYRDNYSFDYGLDDLYGELYGTTTANNSSSGSTSMTTPSPFGRRGFDLESLEGISLPDIYDILDELLTMFDGVVMKLSLFLTFLLAVLWCFCGYRVFHVFTGITAFLLCNLAGIILAVIGDGGAGLFFLFFVLSIVLLVLCIKFKSFAAFLLGSVNSLPFFALIFLLICKKFNGVWLILTLLFAAALGIVMVIFKKPVIIITTAVEWGPTAGTALACLFQHTHWGAWLGIIFVVGGLLYQTHYHGGLLESGPLLFKKHSTKGTTSEKLPDVSYEETIPSPRSSTKHTVPTSTESESKSRPISAKSPAATEDISHCIKCGAVLQKGATFCTTCGAPQKAKSSGAASAKSPVPSSPPIDSIPVPPLPPISSSTPSKPTDSTDDDAKLKFGTFTRIPEPPSPPSTPGELKISMAEGKTEERKSDPNSKMKPADDFDD